MAAGRHPQDLDDAGRRRLVAVGRGMGNSQAHEVAFPNVVAAVEAGF
jgi:hypothetical protein